jgi:hypothetical protein
MSMKNREPKGSCRRFHSVLNAIWVFFHNKAVLHAYLLSVSDTKCIFSVYLIQHACLLSVPDTITKCIFTECIWYIYKVHIYWAYLIHLQSAYLPSVSSTFTKCIFTECTWYIYKVHIYWVCLIQIQSAYLLSVSDKKRAWSPVSCPPCQLNTHTLTHKYKHAHNTHIHLDTACVMPTVPIKHNTQHTHLYTACVSSTVPVTHTPTHPHARTCTPSPVYRPLCQ